MPQAPRGGVKPSTGDSPIRDIPESGYVPDDIADMPWSPHRVPTWDVVIGGVPMRNIGE